MRSARRLLLERKAVLVVLWIWNGSPKGLQDFGDSSQARHVKNSWQSLLRQSSTTVVTASSDDPFKDIALESPSISRLRLLLVAATVFPLVSIWAMSHYRYTRAWLASTNYSIVTESLYGELQLRITRSEADFLPPLAGVRFEPIDGGIDPTPPYHWYGFAFAVATKDPIIPDQTHLLIVAMPYWFILITASLILTLVCRKLNLVASNEDLPLESCDNGTSDEAP